MDLRPKIGGGTSATGGKLEEDPTNDLRRVQSALLSKRACKQYLLKLHVRLIRHHDITYQATIGIDFLSKPMYLDNRTVRL